LKKFPGTLVVVTHDRYFLNDVTEWILEMDNGRAIPWKGNYAAWLEQKQAIARAARREEQAREKMLARELEWIRLNPSGRMSKSKARLARYEELAKQSFDTREETLEIKIPSGERLGEKVVHAKDLRKTYGNRVIFENVSFDLPRGGIVGVIGPNGAGKSTLLKMIAGRETPDAGTLEIGETVRVSYVDQLREALDGSKTVYEEIGGGKETIEVGGKEMNARAYCTRFNFRGTEQQKRVGDLSGGERNRVHLAKLLKSGGNLLLLDEPTNDLDVTTLRALEEALQGFGGCAVLVSHDRWFLDRIATHILAFEDDGSVLWHEGNFESFQEMRRKKLGPAADQPRRLKFRPI
jgi:ATPase subunit of ABC transporter with duplicated ATPase domains